MDGTKRMINLVNELLELTTSVKGDDQLSFVDTAALLKDVLLGLSASISSSKATVHASELPTVWANHVQLGRVFQNLIENGIKYSSVSKPPEIKVTARAAESEVIFSVEDKGVGISKDHIGRLFTLFERLHPDDGLPGKGIGLSTCRKIVESFGGRMWVSSTPNIGSVFSFSVPHPDDMAQATENARGATDEIGAANVAEHSRTSIAFR